MMQVMMFARADLHHRRRRRARAPAAARLGEPHADAAGAPLLRGAVLPRRVARPAAAARPAWTCRSRSGLAAAFAASAWATLAGEGAVYYDSVTMFIALLLVARYVELVARRRAGDAIEAIARARPATARAPAGWPRPRRGRDGRARRRSPPATSCCVRPGATVPADGDVVDGRVERRGGDAHRRDRGRGAKAPGDAVLAGSVDARQRARRARHARPARRRGSRRIERLVERAAERAAARRARRRSRRRVVRRARCSCSPRGTALVVVAARSVARAGGDVRGARRVLPVRAVAGDAGGARGRGGRARRARQVVVARADALETLARVTHVVFDKTGTLTDGPRRAASTSLPLAAPTRDDALALAAALEAPSEHPLARRLSRRGAGGGRAAAGRRRRASSPGNGVEGIVAGRRVRLGRPDVRRGAVGRPLPRGADARRRRRRRWSRWATPRGLHRAVRARRRAAARRARRSSRACARSASRRCCCRATARRRVAAVARDARHRRRARRRAAGGQARRPSRALQARRRGRRDGRRRHQRRAVARAGAGVGEPRQRDAARAVDRRRRRAVRRPVARSRDAIAHARRTFRVVRAEPRAGRSPTTSSRFRRRHSGYVTPLVAALGMSVSSLLVVGNALRRRAAARARRRSRRGPRCAPAPALEPRMDILLLLIPLSVVLVLADRRGVLVVGASGQFDDLEGPAHRILADDDTSDAIPAARRRRRRRTGRRFDFDQARAERSPLASRIVSASRLASEGGSASDGSAHATMGRRRR